MSWVYEQSTGKLLAPATTEVVAIGYSGKGLGRNNPGMQQVANRGPIPVGFYRIGTPHDTVTHGPYVLPLDPIPDNQMFGRAGFLIHGDSTVAPGTASEGCIILPRTVREQIWKSGERWLQVITGPFIVTDPKDDDTVA